MSLIIEAEKDAHCIVAAVPGTDACLRLEEIDIEVWCLTVVDADWERGELLLDADEVCQLADAMSSFVGGPAPKHPLVKLLEALPGTLEYVVRLAGGNPDVDSEALLDGRVTDNLRAAATNRGIEL